MECGAMRGTERPRTVIDLARVRANAEAIARRTGVPLIAVVKADAYGQRTTLTRLGAGLHYARLSAGVASEMGTFAGNIYQLTLSTGFK